MGFGLPEKMEVMLPAYPFEQLVLARKNTSIAVLILLMLLFDSKTDFRPECSLLRQIQRHGEGYLPGCSDCKLGSRGPGRGLAPSTGLGRGPRREVEDWRKADKNRRIWGPGCRMNPPSSRPPARDPVHEDGDYGFHEEYIGDDPGYGAMPTATTLLLLWLTPALKMMMDDGRRQPGTMSYLPMAFATYVFMRGRMVDRLEPLFL